jgi:hypothetical protein
MKKQVRIQTAQLKPAHSRTSQRGTDHLTTAKIRAQTRVGKKTVGHSRAVRSRKYRHKNITAQNSQTNNTSKQKRSALNYPSMNDPANNKNTPWNMYRRPRITKYRFPQKRA